MANDAFNRSEFNYGGAISTDTIQLNFAGSELGLIVQQLKAQYQQSVNQMYSLGDAKIFFVAGQPSGNGSMSGVVGPKSALGAFSATYGDICKVGSNVLNIVGAETFCGGDSQSASQLTVTCNNVLLTGIGVGADANQGMITADLGMQFSRMSIS